MSDHKAPTPQDQPFLDWLSRAVLSLIVNPPTGCPVDPIASTLRFEFAEDADGIGSTLALNDGDEQLLIARGSSGDGVYCALDIADDFSISTDSDNLHEALVGIETDLRLRSERMNDWLARVVIMRQRARVVPPPPALPPLHATPPTSKPPQVDPFDPPPSPKPASTNTIPADIAAHFKKIEEDALRKTQQAGFEAIRQAQVDMSLCASAVKLTSAIAARHRSPIPTGRAAELEEFRASETPTTRSEASCLDTFPACPIVRIPELDEQDQSQMFGFDETTPQPESLDEIARASGMQIN